MAHLLEKAQNADVLKHVGTLKNELLVFGVIGCVLLNGSAFLLDTKTDQAQKWGGLAMHLSTIPLLFLLAGAYLFALFYLPSSRQELMFSEEASRMIEQHQTKMVRRRRTVRRETTVGPEA